jgi:hypothetical protein
MYKIKIFTNYSTEIEKEINRWFSLNPHIVIDKYQHTNDESRSFISIIYTENETIGI